MAAGWDRRTPLLSLDDATLARLLAPRWADARIQSAERISGGLANTNYRVLMEGREESLVVRVYTREPEACAREAALLRLVAESVPVPEVLYAEPEVGRFEHPYIVLSWMDGVPFEDALATLPAEEAPALAAALGATAARIGSFTFAEPGFLDANLNIRERLVIGPEGLRAWIPDMLRGRAGERLGAELTARLLRQIERHADELAPLAGQRALIHADYRNGNILVRRDDTHGWRVSAVLDWEFAFVGASVFDLGSLLRREAELPPGFADACVAAYRAQGGFAPPNWRRMTLLMDLVNLCDFLNAPHPRAAMVADLTALVRATVERLEHGKPEGEPETGD